MQRGAPLYSIYSPELLSAQEEYLLALRTQKTMSGGGSMSGDGDALVRASRRKLELWDVPASEIAAHREGRRGVADRHVLLPRDRRPDEEGRRPRDEGERR